MIHHPALHATPKRTMGTKTPTKSFVWEPSPLEMTAPAVPVVGCGGDVLELEAVACVSDEVSSGVKKSVVLMV